MPFKDRLKQLNYMREYSAKHNAQRLTYEHDKLAEKLLWNKVVPTVRPLLKMRQTLNLQTYENSPSEHFICEPFKLQNLINFNPSLEQAINLFVDKENKYLEGIKMLIVIKDVQVTILNKDYGLIWEILG